MLDTAMIIAKMVGDEEHRICSIMGDKIVNRAKGSDQRKMFKK